MTAVLAPPRTPGITPRRKPRVVDACHELYRIPAQAIEALSAVEMCGWDDMCDRRRVLALARVLGRTAGADWLDANRHLYFMALRQARGR